MAKKLESLIKLAAMNFNTPDFEAIMDKGEVHQFEKQMQAWERVSIRADYKFGHPILLPFKPNLPWEKALEEVRSLLDLHDKMIVIISKGIDPKDSQIAGKYLATLGDCILEYYTGPGTIRDLEGDKVKRHTKRTLGLHTPRIEKGTIPDDQRKLVNIMMNETGKVFDAPFVVEWSVYPYPVGKKGQRLILWEIEQW